MFKISKIVLFIVNILCQCQPCLKLANSIYVARMTTSRTSDETTSINSSSTKIDLNSSDFDAEEYVRCLLRNKSIDELVAVEEEMVRSVRSLDSEMREMVYENYNKFLLATSAIRNMQDRLNGMRHDLSGLSEKMQDITSISTELSQRFVKNCDKISELKKKLPVIADEQTTKLEDSHSQLEGDDDERPTSPTSQVFSESATTTDSAS